VEELEMQRLDSNDLKKKINPKENQIKTNDVSVVKRILSDKNIFFNSVIFCLYWHSAALIYIGITLAMETFEGDIFLTMFLFGFLETSASFLAGILVSKFDLKLLLIVIGSICSIVLIFQIFLSSYWTVVFAVISKGNVEIMWTLLLTALMKIVPLECHQFIFAFSMVFSRFIMIGLDFYNEAMISIGMSPLIGFGANLLIAVLCTFKMKYI
jgi:hypothetical protein